MPVDARPKTQFGLSDTEIRAEPLNLRTERELFPSQ